MPNWVPGVSGLSPGEIAESARNAVSGGSSDSSSDGPDGTYTYGSGGGDHGGGNSMIQTGEFGGESVSWIEDINGDDVDANDTPDETPDAGETMWRTGEEGETTVTPETDPTPVATPLNPGTRNSSGVASLAPTSVSVDGGEVRVRVRNSGSAQSPSTPVMLSANGERIDAMETFVGAHETKTLTFDASSLTGRGPVDLTASAWGQSLTETVTVGSQSSPTSTSSTTSTPTSAMDAGGLSVPVAALGAVALGALAVLGGVFGGDE